MQPSRDGALRRAEECFDSGAYLEALRRLVAVPTESQMAGSQPALTRYCEETIPALMDGMGFEGRVIPNPGFGPVYVGTRIEDPALPTILVYGHGDVVRGLAGKWTDGLDPFAVTVKGDKWYGRGTVDNKGQHLIAIEALRAVIAERGRLGFNAKVLVETGEEQGSPGLRDMIVQHRDALAADVFIGLDGPRQTTFMPELKLGARGGIAFDLVVHLRNEAHHSGHWGGVLRDPGFVLAHALASIVDQDGKILVEGWTPKSVPPGVRQAIAGLVFEDIPGLPEADPKWGEPGLTKAEKIFGWTSVIVLAQITGHPDAPTNAVQGEARARLQIRHTADVPAKDFLPALRAHLDARGFEGVQIIPVAERDVFGAARTDPYNPWVGVVAESMTLTAGRAPNIVPNSSGSNPSDMFIEELGMPVIWIPNSYAGCNQHGPDEHALAPLLREGMRLMAGIWWDIGEGKRG
ncbi:M20/M25/M40 family metallo-hydrolase [Roseococcus suduntuyensis]|uniref:Acetylornithine deacetylase/succinyl-diaminopimelate desuccinylase-like protein n=1 Tax=Roseococcus suduntuyensis TaxID=455361 RepID=A0A840ACP3_9PROT|nr:M20/M25/M40 family metallo-hydrolase [Roseococcus suduntuyensis]MBB3899718.1 acetylornithine deacetylase/succinyl-diaminopimelate desuccinylase-like protein [Roseococcus suduntuyensis]